MNTHPFTKLPNPTNNPTLPMTDESKPAMPSSPSSFSLTLILATTPSLGIGKNGTLPWPQLKKEMGYFARVTKRVPSCAVEGGRKRVNAVVMGRKTWDSIPVRFRPLKGRLNVVVTREVEGFSKRLDKVGEDIEGPLVVGSVQAALDKLRSLSSQSSPPLSNSSSSSNPATVPKEHLEIDRIFIIGGASIYTAALALPQADRILLTKIKKDYECDTSFSIDLEKEGSGWRRMGKDAMEEWTGEVIKEEGEVEGDVEFEFCGFERVG